MPERILGFFQALPLPADRLTGHYDLRLVALSYMVAVFASYIALDLTGRLRDKNNTKMSSLLWLLGGAIAMGSGIWSMHFIGMLSFSIPGITLQYDLYWTIFSLIVAILASGFALFLLKKSIINIVHLIAGGVLLGLAIASMHYTGMEGMLITLNIRYLPDLFLLSVIIAILASEAAIWLALKSTKVILRMRNRIKFVSAVIMGIAICGMHYTGMAASIFTPLCMPSLLPADHASLDPTVLSMAIASVTFMILSVAFFASNTKEAANQQQFEQARQLGMAEISASVLHNVGNVLNSLNVSANTIAEKLSGSKSSSGLDKLSQLFNAHKHDLSAYLTQENKGEKVVEFINTIAAHHDQEKQNFLDEIKVVIKYIGTIKDIISTQQTLSKTIGFENIILLNEVLEEALSITGVILKKEITLEKQFEKIPPMMVDKVKLLQVLVNLINNAKDALLQSSNTNKVLSLSMSVKNNIVTLQVKDNGIGILPKNMSNIFRHGFTTKENGHGFGLHTSALIMSELGGEILVESGGHEKGAAFTLHLPYREPK